VSSGRHPAVYVAAAAAAMLFGLAVELLLATGLLSGWEAATLSWPLLARWAFTSGLVLLVVVVAYRRILRLQEELGAAMTAEAKFRGLLEAAPDAVVIVNESGRMMLVNSQAEHIFGYDRARLIGQPADMLLPENERGKHRGHIVDPQATAELPLGSEIVGHRIDGTNFPAEIRVSPLQSEEGPLFIKVIRDVTERRKAEDDRARSLEQLQELERLKDLDRFKTEFINMAAHELGTPLTPIKLQISLLKGARGVGLDDDQRKAITILDRNVDRLSQLVQDVLEVARIQAGRLGVNKHPADLNRVVMEAAESFQETARVSGVTLESRLSPDLVADIDPKRVTQVLFNLLSNALKFTPRGGTVVLETTRQGDYATVKVRDTGTGLRPEDVPKLFRPFSQVHDTMQRTKGGTGLGLYISKGIVELHGGRIWVESPGPGHGATFAFTVPAEPGAAPLPPVTEEAQEAAPADTLVKRAKELI
jgi:PAS domain S-box-containing protein